MKGSATWIIIAAILIGFFYRDFTGEPLNKTKPITNKHINNILQKTAKEQNKNLPIRFRTGDEWSAVSAGNMRLTHFYRLSSPHQSKNNLFSSVKNGVCSDPYTSKLIAQGVSIEYVYRDSSNTHLFEFTINSSDCY